MNTPLRLISQHITCHHCVSNIYWCFLEKCTTIFIRSKFSSDFCKVQFYYGPEGRPYSNHRVRLSVCSSVTDYFCWQIVVCVSFSSETTWSISPMMKPINWGNNVDVQNTLHFDLDPCMVKVMKYFDFVNLDVWQVVVCGRFSSETTWPISPMMIPINWGNNVDVQCTLHFDLDLFMTAGQGLEIFWFCEFRCLTGSSLCSPLRNYSTEFSNADANLLREQCKFILHFDLPWLQVKVTKYFNFVNFLCLTGSSLCSFLLQKTTQPISPKLYQSTKGTM